MHKRGISSQLFWLPLSWFPPFSWVESCLVKINSNYCLCGWFFWFSNSRNTGFGRNKDGLNNIDLNILISIFSYRNSTLGSDILDMKFLKTSYLLVMYDLVLYELACKTSTSWCSRCCLLVSQFQSSLWYFLRNARWVKRNFLLKRVSFLEERYKWVQY